MSGRTDNLKQLIQTDQAIKMVRSAEDYHEAEEFALTVLADEKSPAELVEAALESFLVSHGACECKPYHGYWVHSLSHFTNVLWERRMDGWIKKFNEVAFKGAIELGDSNCSDRLVYDFAALAKWDDDPADFHLTPENLRWMDWEYATYSKARIEAGHFESEEAFLRWKLQHPEAYTKSSQWGGLRSLVDADKMHSMIQRLKELGADSSEFDELAKNLLTKQMSELEAKAAEKDWDDWIRKILEEEIQKTRAALEALA